MSAEIHTRAESSSPPIPHVYPGKLIAAEGLDGSGKSTQLQLLQFWLQGEALESFRNFENRMYSEYQQMQKEFGFRVIEGKKSKSKQ
jgi:thymidylate kinase